MRNAMKKTRILLIVLSALCLLSFTACRSKETIILHCDRCGKEIEFPSDTNMTEDWLIVCSDCQNGIDP